VVSKKTEKCKIDEQNSSVVVENKKYYFFLGGGEQSHLHNVKNKNMEESL